MYDAVYPASLTRLLSGDTTWQNLNLALAVLLCIWGGGGFLHETTLADESMRYAYTRLVLSCMPGDSLHLETFFPLLSTRHLGGAGAGGGHAAGGVQGAPAHLRPPGGGQHPGGDGARVSLSGRRVRGQQEFGQHGSVGRPGGAAGRGHAAHAL